MAENKFLVFGENVSSTDTLTDESYATDVTRLGGNTVGIARRAPNNKALKQSTLMAAAVGDYILEDAAEGTPDLTDEQTHTALSSRLSDKIKADIDKRIQEDPTLVRTSGDQSIAGIKSFQVPPETGVDPLKDNQLANKGYVDAVGDNTYERSKQYTDLKVGDLRDYVDKKDSEILEQAKEYTDSAVENSGGGSGPGGTVLPPEIISPADGATGVLITAELMAGPFRSAYPDNNRTLRHFQVTKGAWDACIIDQKVNADSYQPDDRLPTNTPLKWRCCDESSLGLTSAWSAVSSFTTGGELFVNTPTLTVEGSPSNVFEDPLLTGSAFSVNQGSDTLEQVRWTIIRKSDRKTVWDHTVTGSETTIRVPKGILQQSTEYSATVRYKGAEYNWSQTSPEAEFTTVSQFVKIVQPTVSVTGGTTDVGRTPTITGSAFTVVPDGYSDTHASSTWVISQTGGQDVYRLDKSATALTTLTVPAGVLHESQTYTVKLTYHGTKYGNSAVGTVSFTCRATFEGITRPTITVQGTNTDAVDYSSIFVGSDFVYTDEAGETGTDTCDKVDWVLYQADSVVWSERDSTKIKYLGYFPEYSLKESTRYVLKYRQHAKTNDKWSDWAELIFTTAAELNIPTIKFKMKNKINLSNIFTWWSTADLHVYKNGALDAEITGNPTTDHALSSSGDIIEIKNFKGENNYPRMAFSGIYQKNSEDMKANLISVEAPFPTLRMTNNGVPVTDFGGDAGDLSSLGRGVFCQCTALKTLPKGLFKFNPQVTNFGAMGGGGGGGTGSSNGSGGNGGSYRQGIKGSKGATQTNSTSSSDDAEYGRTGYGCFSYCSSLTELPEDLFAYTPNITNFGAFGGGGGGAGNGDWSDPSPGGDAYGCFAYCSSLTSLPDDLFAYTPNVTNFGAFAGGSGGSLDRYGCLGGNGGDAYGCFAYCSGLRSIPEMLFRNTVNVKNFSGIGGADAVYSKNNDYDGFFPLEGLGGKAYGCFAYCTALTTIPAGLFMNTPEVDNFGGYGALAGGSARFKSNSDYTVMAGGGAGYYGGGGATSNGDDTSWKVSWGGENSAGESGRKEPTAIYNRYPSTGAGGGGCYTGGASFSRKFTDELPPVVNNGGQGHGDTPNSVKDTTYGIFSGCSRLKSIPENLFSGWTKVKQMQSVFRECSSLRVNCHIKGGEIPSRQAGNFAAGTAAKGTVFVPAGSTTASTFKGDSTTNVNVIEE